MMAAGGTQPRSMPAILDLKVAGGQAHNTHCRSTLGRSRSRLSILGQNADCRDPVSILTPASKRPSAIHPQTAGLGDGSSNGLSSSSAKAIRTISIGFLVGLARQQWHQQGRRVVQGDDPPRRAVDLDESLEDASDCGEIKFQATM